MPNSPPKVTDKTVDGWCFNRWCKFISGMLKYNGDQVEFTWDDIEDIASLTMMKRIERPHWSKHAVAIEAIRTTLGKTDKQRIERRGPWPFAHVGIKDQPHGDRLYPGDLTIDQISKNNGFIATSHIPSPDQQALIRDDIDLVYKKIFGHDGLSKAVDEYVLGGMSWRSQGFPKNHPVYSHMHQIRQKVRDKATIGLDRYQGSGTIGKLSHAEILEELRDDLAMGRT